MGRTLLLGIAFVLFFSEAALGQLVIDNSLTPTELVEKLVGEGVEISNITFKGHKFSSGSFSKGGTTNLGFNEGIIFSTGAVDSAVGPNNNVGMTFEFSTTGDNDLNSLLAKANGITVEQLLAAENGTQDASVLEFDFKPLSDTISFEYIFGSEEYNNFVNTKYNDIFAFFLTGPNPAGGNYTNYNMARIPKTNLFVSINNINNGTEGTGPCENCEYFIDNTSNSSDTSIEYDGFTKQLTAGAKVVPCETYHFKIAIADVSDKKYDSGVFLRAKSFKGKSLKKLKFTNEASAGKIAYEGCNYPIFIFSLDKPIDEDIIIYLTKSGTATEGVDFPKLPDTVVIPAGDTIRQFTMEVIEDSITEGTENFRITFNTDYESCKEDTFNITIEDHLSQTISLSNDTIICLNESTQLISNVTGGSPPYTYAWSPSDSLNDTTIQNPIANPTKKTTYTARVYDKVGCYVESDVTIRVNPLPGIMFQPSDKDTLKLCANETYTLSATGGDSLWWHDGFSNGEMIQTNALGLGDSLFIASTLNQTTGCIGRDSLVLNINAAPTISLSPSNDTAICLKENISLTASGGDSVWWNRGIKNSEAFSPTQTNDYVATIINLSTRCKAMDTIEVAIKPLPAPIHILADTTHIYRGESINLTVIDHDSINSLKWNTGNMEENLHITPTKTTTFTATATNSYSCRISDSIQIVVIQWVVDLGDDIHVCEESRTLTLMPTTNPQPADYLWNTGDNTSEITITLDTNATFTLSATIGNYSQTDAINITFSDLAFGEPPYKGCFSFIDIIPINGKPPYRYSLDNITYQEDDRFLNIESKEYTLFIKDSADCQIDTMVLVKSIDLPNYFSPNGDEINDTWLISGLEDCPYAEIMVFDRFSRLLRKMHPTETWDGSFKNILMPDGTYWFVLDFKDGINKPIKSSLSIKRE